MNNYLKSLGIVFLILSISACAGIDREKFLSSLPKSEAESILLFSDCNFVRSGSGETFAGYGKMGVCSISKNGLNIYKDSDPNSKIIMLDYNQIDSMNLIKSSSFLGEAYSITIALKSNQWNLGFSAAAIRKSNEKGLYDSKTLNEFTEKYYSLLKEKGVKIDDTLPEVNGTDVYDTYNYTPIY
jgi:hypothetical protein